jgi:hypothetical protein
VDSPGDQVKEQVFLGSCKPDSTQDNISGNQFVIAGKQFLIALYYFWVHRSSSPYCDVLGLLVEDLKDHLLEMGIIFSDISGAESTVEPYLANYICFPFP